MTNKRDQALEIVGKMLSPEMAVGMAETRTSNEFGAYIGELALNHAFADLWTRPGLDRRLRSLITLSMLIGLRAADELAIHTVAAVRNGVTIAELEEVIYHASAYAGFPAAASARKGMLAALRSAGLVSAAS